jgi:hypothetical protein
MSCTQLAFIQRERIPDRASLQYSIDSLGFDLKLHPELNLLEDTGFVPCVLCGESNVGFELFACVAEEITGDEEEFQAIAGDNDWCISLIWHSSMKDCACAMVVCCALAKDFGAVTSFEGEPPQDLPELLQATLGIIEDAKKENDVRGK